MSAISYPQYKALVFGAGRTALSFLSLTPPPHRTPLALEAFLRRREQEIVESFCGRGAPIPREWDHYRACAMVELERALLMWNRGSEG